jgi:hypothetical protein
MKKRHGFVSNSSSASFLVTNISGLEKTTCDFVKEIGEELSEIYSSDYAKDLDYDDVCPAHPEGIFKKISKDSKIDYYFRIFKPGESHEITFGSQDDTLLGLVFYDILPHEGVSENFSWETTS